MRPNKSDFDWAKQVIEVAASCGLKDRLECKEFDEWYDTADKTLEEIGMEYTCGLTKLCFYDTEASKIQHDWVIKIGQTYGNNEDYQKLEYDIYNLACDKNIEQYFAATYFVDCFEGHPYYLQECLTIDDSNIEDRYWSWTCNHTDRDDYEDDCDFEDAVNENCDDLETEERLEALYGESEEVEILIEFCFEHDINDLHSLNVGISDYGNYKMLDYSGYHG